MATEIQMPQITMTMVEGVIAEWHKKKGDPVTEGEPLVDIETDKVVQTLNASASGTLLEILADSGDIVPVGKVFCVIGEAGSRPEPAQPPAPVSEAPAPSAPPALASSGRCTEIEMPQITMTMVEGVIAGWHKKEGDPVQEGEPLADIETDKVVQTLNAAASGVLLKILAREGDIVPVGKVFCVIGEPGSAPSPAAAPAPETPKAAVSPAPAATEALSERTVPMPQVTPQMKDAVIIRWLCAENDLVEAGEPLVKAEVDDTVRVIPAPEGGVIGTILAPSGRTLCPGEALYTLKTSGCAPEAAAPAPRAGYICATPLAKALAAHAGLDLAKVTPTGPDGMIVESDVKKTMVTPQTKPMPAPAPKAQTPAEATSCADDEEIIPFTGIRRRIADNLMVTKRTMADVTTFAEVNMSKVKAFREFLHISYNCFILKAAALALGEFPIMNSSISGDRIIVKKSVGLCVAVSTKRGLVTPVMHHAEKMNLIGVAEQLNDYASRGRDGKLTAQDFEGGTFTVTNSGTYGALFFTPIINQPQSAILGVGKIMMTPIVDENGQIAAAPMMYACLSYDHRVVDGETAVKFLQRIKFYLEHPDQMTAVRK